MKNKGAIVGQESLLKDIGIFSALSGEDLCLVQKLMRERRCAKGEVLFVEGAVGDELFVVSSGRVGISLVLADGKELVISEVGAGGFFGEMSLIERAPRSATCKALEDSVLLSLHAKDFDVLVSDRPLAAAKIMQRMLAITAGRLLNTGSFLSQMVQWGEGARKRAVTDEATGLFNRRFLDESLDGLFERARVEGKKFSIAMFDLDRFGALNKAYGQSFGDKVIVEMAKVFRAVFRERDILVRYGGDEFTFVFPETGGTEARVLCEKLCAAIRDMRFAEDESLRLSASLGVACYPEHSKGLDELKAEADRALYRAKEEGRDRACLPVSLGGSPGSVKVEPRSIAERNRIVTNIVKVVEQSNGFLIVGHHNPDEDCIASMVAFSLLLSKLKKRVYIYISGKIHEQFDYLYSICKYNSIKVIREGEKLPESINVVVAMDTPKPDMLDGGPGFAELVGRGNVRKIEIDHHLEADSRYFGDLGYNLVAGASSASELVGLFAFKLDLDAEFKARVGLDEIFTRNLVLSVLTGMIGDSRMGKYLKTKKERWYYQWFSALFDRMLVQKTLSNSGNFNSKEEVFTAIDSLLGDEEECYRLMMAKAQGKDYLRWVALGEKEIEALNRSFGNETIVSVSKNVADSLAEECGYLGLVVYPDDPKVSSLVQCRLRRSQIFQALDLRDFLSRNSFTNGGGHPGAVGFRFEKSEIADVEAFAADIARRAIEMVKEKK